MKNQIKIIFHYFWLNGSFVLFTSKYKNSFHLYPLKWLLSNRITSVGEGVEKLEPLCTVGNVNRAAAVEKQYDSSSKN